MLFLYKNNNGLEGIFCMIKKDKNTITIMIYLVMVIIVVITIVNIFFYREKLLFSDASNKTNYHEYEKHYAMLTSQTDLPFWQAFYQEAKSEGEKYNAYVEYMGQDLSNDYSVHDLFRIAMDCGVDGIIVEADDSSEMTELINEAVQRDIIVITILHDNQESERQCFVGINNYNLGQIYGEQLVNIVDQNTRKIIVLVDAINQTANQNIIYSGIKEMLGKNNINNNLIDMEPVIIDNESAFSAEEAIRDIVIDAKNLPDIMICLSSIDTQCAYQAVVDYNKVGEISILGYYSSPDILAAIQKEIIQSTVSIDAKQMADLAITAINEYETSGYVSDYLPVDAHLITLQNVDDYIEVKDTDIEDKDVQVKEE